MGEQQVRQKWTMNWASAAGSSTQQIQEWAVDAVGLQAEHTYMDARTYARTHIRGGSDREKERERRPIGEPFESLGGLLCDAAVQLGGAMVWSRTPRTGPPWEMWLSEKHWQPRRKPYLLGRVL